MAASQTVHVYGDSKVLWPGAYAIYKCTYLTVCPNVSLTVRL